MVRLRLCALLSAFCPALSAGADTLVLRDTPVLTATLPVSTTWEVELSANNGTTWNGTGFLAAGSLTPVTIRLDGLPASLLYRLSRVGAAATITPSIARGYTLTGATSADAQVAIENTVDLVSWADGGAGLADGGGAWLHAVRPPLPARQFFRVKTTDAMVSTASVTSYDATSPGYAGFAPVADDMPAVYRSGYLAALPPQAYHRDGMNAAAAGECYELAGPDGRATVIVADINTQPPPGTVDAGRGYFDLALPGFAAITGMSSGSATVSARLVPAPVSGNMKLLVVNNSNGYYLELRVYNHRAGISKLEIQSSGRSDWLTLPRSEFNSFVFSGITGLPQLIFPLKVRITSRFGETISTSPIVAMATNDRISAPGQFTVFPDLAPVPVFHVGPVYTDHLSTTPGDFWTVGGYNGATIDTADTRNPYDGTASARLDHLAGFSGLVFSHYPLFSKPDFTELRLALRSGSSTNATGMGLVITGYNSLGLSMDSAVLSLPSLTGSWRVFRVPLDAIATPVKISGFRLVNLTGAAQPPVQMDAVSFRSF